MSDELKKEWDEIQNLVAAYQKAAAEEDQDTCLNLRFELADKICNAVCAGKNSCSSGNVLDACTDLLYPELKEGSRQSDIFLRYDPEKGRFENFFMRSLKFQRRTVFANESGKSAVREWNEAKGEKVFQRVSRNSSLNKQINDDSRETYLDRLTREDVGGAASDSGNPEDMMIAALEDEQAVQTAVKVLTLFLNLRLPGRQNNETRKKYYRLFFTDSTVTVLKTPDLEEYARAYRNNETDVFKAIVSAFLDFFMVGENRTVDAIIDGAMKKYSDIGAAGRTEEIRVPLSNAVYREYLAQKEGWKVGDSAISNHRKNYESFIRDIFTKGKEPE